MGHFLDQFGLVFIAAPIMPTAYFPVNFYPMLKPQTRKSLNEFRINSVDSPVRWWAFIYNFKIIFFINVTGLWRKLI